MWLWSTAEMHGASLWSMCMAGAWSTAVTRGPARRWLLLAAAAPSSFMRPPLSQISASRQALVSQDSFVLKLLQYALAALAFVISLVLPLALSGVQPLEILKLTLSTCTLPLTTAL